jgi:hypothetical protein
MLVKLRGYCCFKAAVDREVELLNSTYGMEFLEQLSAYQHLRKESAACS